MEKMRNAFEILVGKPEGTRSLERPGRRREMDLKEILNENVD
jgi:hypothetical protein